MPEEKKMEGLMSAEKREKENAKERASSLLEKLKDKNRNLMKGTGGEE